MTESVLVILKKLNKNSNKAELCLGLKMHGFAEGLWNGFGGKVKEGEDILSAAVREVNEECSIDIDYSKLNKVCELEYYEADDDWKVHVFTYDLEEGNDPIETYEMRPQWFTYNEIPYEDMWPNDVLWLKRVLKGEKLKGKVWNDSEGDVIKYDFTTVKSFK